MILRLTRRSRKRFSFGVLFIYDRLRRRVEDFCVQTGVRRPTERFLLEASRYDRIGFIRMRVFVVNYELLLGCDRISIRQCGWCNTIARRCLCDDARILRGDRGFVGFMLRGHYLG